MDFLKSLFGVKRDEAEKADLERAGKLAEAERERRASEIYPECATICGEIRSAFSEIRDACGLFEQSRAELNPDLRPAVKSITKKMRENFIARMRVAAGLEIPSKQDYGQFAGFSARLEETMAEIAKINSDNRYIFTFYTQDVERFKAPFERASKLTQRLKGLVEGKREDAERFSRLSSQAKLLQSEKERLRQSEAELALSENRLSELKAELAGVGGSAMLEEKRAELSKASEELASLGANISAQVMLLERALRKYGRICDPSENPRKYAEAPLQELLKEGREYPEFKATLERVGKLIESGQLELKNREKILEQAGWIADGNLSPLLEKHMKLQGELRRLEAELEPIHQKERERQALESSIEQLSLKIEKQKKHLEEAHTRFEAGKRELEQVFSKAFGKELLLTD